MPPPLPVTLDLAPLPRAQVGPFLYLGVDKDADREAIEAGWAQRLIWARKGITRAQLEDINWARDMLSDLERRLKADVTSFNIDTTDGVLKQLKTRFQGKDVAHLGCRPLDVEKNLAGYEPPVAVPDLEEVRRSIPEPHVPRDIPAVQAILQAYAAQPLDAWDADIEAFRPSPCGNEPAGPGTCLAP